jgi:hypothetical protein
LVLEIEARESHMLNKCSTTNNISSPLFLTLTFKHNFIYSQYITIQSLKMFFFNIVLYPVLLLSRCSLSENRSRIVNLHSPKTQEVVLLVPGQ